MFIGTILLLCRETAILLGSVLGSTALPGRQLYLDAKTKLITPCLGQVSFSLILAFTVLLSLYYDRCSISVPSILAMHTSILPCITH
jgi:hypothetical protein